MQKEVRLLLATRVNIKLFHANCEVQVFISSEALWSLFLYLFEDNYTTLNSRLLIVSEVERGAQDDFATPVKDIPGNVGLVRDVDVNSLPIHCSPACKVIGHHVPTSFSPWVSLKTSD